MARRRAAIADVMEREGTGHLLVYSAGRATAGQWLTGWPVTAESVVLLSAAAPDILFVQLRNHVPNAREIAAPLEVRWGGASTMSTAIDELRARGASGPVGVIGPLPFQDHRILGSALGSVVDLSASYGRLRRIKSDEELEWVRRGVELTDRSIRALRLGLSPGLTEHHLADLVERAYVPDGGTTHIHFFVATPMADPERCVPAQWPSARTLRPGDALVTELSAAFWGYPGQILQTFTVAADPTPLYRELHDVAEAALDAILGVLRAGATPREVIEAASVIEDSGFTTYDDLVHGFVGGYLDPVLGSRSRALREVPEEPFEAGMTVVVQPNVITQDERAGVQVGELVLITPTGVERLHRSERGLLRVGE